MGKKSARKPSAAARLASPRPRPAEIKSERSPTLSPLEFPTARFEFNVDGFEDIGTSKSLKKERGKTCPGSSISKVIQSTGLCSSPRSLTSVTTISDLKEMASSTLDSIKKHLERSHSEILRDVEASQCRLQKRFKIQTQACEQIMDEAEKEHKKISERINEGREAMKASYAEFIAEAQATASRFYKTSIPEASQRIEKDIASLKNRYGISSNAA